MPNNFGLSTQEILGSSKEELNKWVHVRHLYQYRPEEKEKYDLHKYNKRGKQLQRKKKVLKTLYADVEAEQGDEKSAASTSDQHKTKPSTVTSEQSLNNIKQSPSSSKDHKKKRKQSSEPGA